MTAGASADLAGAATASQAVANLNEVRVANGIPPITEIDDRLSLGCRLHSRYMETARNYRGGSGYEPHKEIPGEPFHTALGARAGESSMLHHGGNEDYLRRFMRRPRAVLWVDAPAHFQGLLNPAASRGWYGDWHGNACMGVGGRRDEATLAPFYSLPGDGTRNVPLTTTIYGEWPSNPAEDAGFRMGETIGPFIYLWSTRFGQIEAAELVGPDGAVDIRTHDNSYVFIAHALVPATTYRLTVNWSIPHPDDRPWDPHPPEAAVQNVTFTTGLTPIGPPVRAPWRLVAVRAKGKTRAVAVVDAKAPMAGRTVQMRLRWTGCRGGWNCRPLGVARTSATKLKVGRNRIRIATPPRPRGATHLLAQFETKKFIKDRVAYGKTKGRLYRGM